MRSRFKSGVQNQETAAGPGGADRRLEGIPNSHFTREGCQVPPEYPVAADAPQMAGNKERGDLKGVKIKEGNGAVQGDKESASVKSQEKGMCRAQGRSRREGAPGERRALRPIGG